MKLFACIKKDIRLVFGKGWKSVLLLIVPIVLLLAMSLFMGKMANAGAFTEPFAIAVRDEDDTVMSKMLIQQLRAVALFDSVRSVKGGTDEEILTDDCAAVITIPKDFFYDLYDMQDTDVVITLRGSMPRESAIVKSAIGALAGILEQNQRIYYAAARIRYGELHSREMNEVYYRYSEASVNDALNRLAYFSIGSLYEDELQSRTVFFAAGICSVLILFVPLCVLRSLQEEREMGIHERFVSSGSSSLLLLAAKYLADLLLIAFSVAVLLIVTRIPHAGKMILPLLCLTTVSFLLFYLIGMLCGSTERAQLIGSVMLLLMLLLGGAIFPYRLLPEKLQFAAAATVPYYVERVFYAVSLDRGVSEIARILLPVLIAIPVMTAAAVLLHRIRRRV